MENEKMETILVEDEDGVEVEYLVYDNFKFEGGTFVALLKPGEEEAVLLQLVDGEYLESIEDEELLEKVIVEFDNRNSHRWKVQ